MLEPIAFKPKEIKVLEAFLQVTQEQGIEAVTLQKVADKAGMAYSSVHYYFGKPERNLIDSAFNYVVNNSVNYIQNELGPHTLDPKINSLKILIEKKFEWNEKFPIYASIWTYFLYLTQRDPKYKAMNDEINAMMASKIQTVLIQEIGKGRYPIMKKLDVLVAQIQQVLFGGQMLTINTNGKNRLRLTWKMVENLIKDHHEKQQTRQ